MAKKPELSDITKKFDGLVSGIKSMINPAGGTPDVDPDDAIGLKIAELSIKVQQLSERHKEQSRALDEVNRLLNGVFRDIEQLRAAHAETAPKPKAKPEAASPEVSEAAKPQPSEKPQTSDANDEDKV